MQFLNFKNSFKFAFFTALICVEILSLLPKSPEIILKSWDKFNHFLAFSTLFVLFNLAFKSVKFRVSFALLLLFGIQIEIVQSFTPNREFSFFDILADVVGLIFGILVLKFTNKLMKFRGKIL